nr:DNA polymerase III subunit gamma and tau [Actinomycetota bacterium]
MTIALYRRYRPETFRDVIGQEHVTEPLMQALRSGRVNHAYLFSGPRGCGKTTSARILARCLNCEQGPTPEPCGVCESCVALARGGPGTVDVIEIDAASHGGVDDARDLRERASYGPAQSRFKVYIIDEAHMVTPQGFNALLKIVEEPPAHVKFVFATTEPDKVIGTIRSRTHHYPFRLVPPARLTAYMEQLCEQEQVSVAPGVLGFVTRAGGGSVRDSLSVLDQLIAGSGDEGLTYEGAAALLGFTDGELLDATIDALAAGDGAAVFSQIDKVIESGHDPRRFVEDLLERLRDLIIVAAVPEGAASVLRGVPEDQLERMRGQQAHFGPGALSRAADIVNAGLTEMTGATAPRMQLELICARILLPAASGSSGYAARLDRLERRLELGGTPSAARPTSAVAPSPVAPSAAVPSAAAPTQPSIASASRSAPVEPAPTSSREDPSSLPAVPPQTSAVGPTSAGSPRETSASVPTEARWPAVSAGSPGSPPSGATTPSGGPGAASGAVDTATLRRVWPDVLARVFTMRRFTWTFLSQHAQVVDYDGSRLVLGIATEGLTQTFRQGKHGDWVRQALIDEIGIDVPVEGIPMADAGAASRAGAAGAAGRTGPARAEPGSPRGPVGPGGQGGPGGPGGQGGQVSDRPERDESPAPPSDRSRGGATSRGAAGPSGRVADRPPVPEHEPDFRPEPPAADEPPPPDDDG